MADRTRRLPEQIASMQRRLGRIKYTASILSAANAPTMTERSQKTLNANFDYEQHSQLIDINQVWEANGNDVLQSVILFTRMEGTHGHIRVSGSNLVWWTHGRDVSALSTCQQVIVRLIELVDAGEYDVTHKNNNGQDALYMLTQPDLTICGYDDRFDLRYGLIRALLRHGAQWRETLPPYMWPQSRSSTGIALLKLVLLHSTIHDSTYHDLNINMLNSDGQTPLHWMIEQRHFEGVKALLADSCIWNIDFTIKDELGRGETAERRARQKVGGARGEEQVRQWLEIAHILHTCDETHQAHFRPLLRDSICVYTPLIPDVINITLDYMYDKAS